MIEITPTQTYFEIRFPYRPMIVEAVKKIKGANFNALNKEDKHWQIPIREKDALLKVGRMFGMSWKAPLRSLKIPDLPTLNVPLPLKTKPFPFQTNGIAAGVNWQRFINGDEMGLGKTFESIGTAVVAQCKCILVVCDASKKYDWQNEWKDHANRRAIIIDKDTKVSWQRYYVQGYCNVFIINYESLLFLASEIRKNEDGNYDSKHIIFVDAIKYFDCIIFDEAHRLRNIKTRMYLLAQGIAWGKRFIMCLTGTPIVNKAEDMLALLRLTGKLEVFGGQRHFINYYCNGDPDRLVEMQQMLYNTCFFRRLKRDVLKQLPAKTYQMVQCDISNRKEYNAAIKEFEQDLRTYRTTHDPELRGRIQAQAILKMMKLKEISAHGKIEIAAQLINEVIEEGQKIVVFIHQRSVGDKLLALFPKAVTVRGSDSMEERDNNVRRFQNDPACNIIIVSIKAGGKGITLTAASNGLFLEWPWHPTDTDQCADRIHRIGTIYPVLLRFLTGRNTIDEVLYKLIEVKRSISNAVMGNEDGFNREVLDIVADSLFNNQTVTI